MPIKQLITIKCDLQQLPVFETAAKMNGLQYGKMACFNGYNVLFHCSSPDLVGKVMQQFTTLLNALS